MDIVSKPNNDRHVLSFSRKLFLSVISLFLVFAVCFIAYQYQREKEYKVELLDTQLQDYNERLQQELRSTPDSLWTSVLNQYIVKGSNKDLRVTIVNLHGDVLYDSYNETSQEVFKNHINRQEIQKALNNGKLVIVPEKEISYYDWRGTGYIVLNTENGAASYMIAGG